MVDKFFEENVKEQELWDAKYYKWLYIDLMIYVNNCIYLSDTESDVKKKIMSMYTDPTHIQISDPGHLEGNCVFTYLDAFSKPEHFEEYLPEYRSWRKQPVRRRCPQNALPLRAIFRLQPCCLQQRYSWEPFQFP